MQLEEMEYSVLVDLRKHQLRGVRALESVDKICKTHNIKYFLIAGSTLGAVRHKGFIPWDDDVDIGMCMYDYNRFKSIIKKSLQEEFTWMHTDVDPNFPTLSGRILYGEEQLVTIFPIVKISDCKVKAMSQWIIRKVMSQVYQRKLHFRNEKDKGTPKKMIVYIISYFISLFFTRESALKILRWNEMRYEEVDTEYYINLYSKYTMKKECIKSKWISNLIQAEYEGGLYPIFEAYDEYLIHLYGNYMKLPPIDKRRPEHIEVC